MISSMTSPSHRDKAYIKSLEGATFYSTGDVGAAYEAYLQVYEIDHDPIAACWAGVCLVHMGKYEEAYPYLESAYRERPDDWRTRTSMGEWLFREGDWLEAWKLWFPVIESPFDTTAVHWDGQDLHGKEVLVTPAGGYGDVFMLARLIPEVAKRFNCRVSFAATEDTVPVFLKQPSMAGVNMTEKREWDYWLHLFDFPRLLQLTPEYIEQRWHPYIESMPMSPNEKPRIGLRLGAGEKGDKFKFRSVPQGDGKQFIDDLAGKAELVPLTMGNPDIQNWIDTIAYISSCDLVISVDTAVLHLAGAMGKETWAVLGDFTDSKWGHDSASVWYPNMRIFRGNGKGYKNSLQQVTAALNQWLLSQSEKETQCLDVTI